MEEKVRSPARDELIFTLESIPGPFTWFSLTSSGPEITFNPRMKKTAQNKLKTNHFVGRREGVNRSWHTMKLATCSPAELPPTIQAASEHTLEGRGEWVSFKMRDTIWHQEYPTAMTWSGLLKTKGMVKVTFRASDLLFGSLYLQVNMNINDVLWRSLKKNITWERTVQHCNCNTCVTELCSSSGRLKQEQSFKVKVKIT